MTEQEIKEWKAFVAGTVNADAIIKTLQSLPPKTSTK
jgi:hypothetical protein